MLKDSVQPMLAHLERQRGLLDQRQKNLRAEFVEVELDLAITFCQIGLSTENADKMDRNETHAKQAYESAMHFLNSVEASDAMKQLIEEKLAHLRALLDELRRKS